MQNNFNITKESLAKLNDIISKMEGRTFHNHYHIIYDICNSLNKRFSYLEIGAFAGGSASLVSSHPNAIKVTSIDIGNPIPKDIPISNVSKFKNSACTYQYIEGDSASLTVINKSKDLGPVDVLFIDGNHTYKYVLSDFNNYKDLVSKSGYIVFDDYMDAKHSPDVKPAVDDIVKKLKAEEFEIIGSLKYDLIKDTNTPELASSNLFVLRKK